MTAKRFHIVTGLCAMAIALMFVPGCGKEEPAQTADVAEEAEEQQQTPEEAEATAGIASFTFATDTLDNEPATQDIFADHDLTLIYVWGTFCEPCVEEMGDYAELYKSLPENANMIGVIFDVYKDSDEYVEDAHKILDDAGAEFTNLRMSDDLDVLLYDIQHTPTALFVDKDGKVVGEVMDGAAFADVKKQLDENLK